MRILLVEDEPITSDLLRAGLDASGFAVDSFPTVEEAESALRAVNYDAVVLDLGLPDGSGLELLRTVRRAGNSAPVLILTSERRLDAKLAGLDTGADDYLVKPIDPRELAARLRAVARRPRALDAASLECGNLSFSPASRELRVAGTPVTLTRREAGILEILLQAKGRPVTKSAIEERLYAFGEELASNSIEVHVHHLRRRLAEAGASVRIATQRGIGYTLAEETA